MTNSKQKVKEICDKLYSTHPTQIVIDLVQDDIEEVLYSDSETPDEVGALVYNVSNLFDVYNPEYQEDIRYLLTLRTALMGWRDDITFANKSLGLDPNK